MGKLYFTIGLPRSGKTTKCNVWAQDYHTEIVGHQLIFNELNNSNPRTIVCADEIRLAVYGQRWWTEGEELVHAIQRIMIVSLLNRHDVIVDGTHTT